MIRASVLLGSDFDSEYFHGYRYRMLKNSVLLQEFLSGQEGTFFTIETSTVNDRSHHDLGSDGVPFAIIERDDWGVVSRICCQSTFAKQAYARISAEYWSRQDPDWIYVDFDSLPNTVGSPFGIVVVTETIRPLPAPIENALRSTQKLSLMDDLNFSTSRRWERACASAKYLALKYDGSENYLAHETIRGQSRNVAPQEALRLVEACAEENRA